MPTALPIFHFVFVILLYVCGSFVQTNSTTISLDNEKVSNNEKNELISLKSIVFNGNQVASEDQLRNIIELKPGLIFLKDLKTQIEVELKRIRTFYYDLGYANAQVTAADLTEIESLKSEDLKFQIVEGKRFKIGLVDFSGSLYLTKTKLFAIVKIDTEPFFSLRVLTEDLLSLADRYKKNGFKEISIVPKAKLNEAKGTIDITFEVEKGPRP